MTDPLPIEPPMKVRRLNARLCTSCVHVAVHHSGLFCSLFNEPLFDERDAETCLGFERAI